MAHDTGIDKARTELRNAGYRCINSHILRNDTVKTGELWFYSGNGEILILVGLWEKAEWVGWDVYAPLTKSNRTDETIAAIHARSDK